MPDTPPFTAAIRRADGHLEVAVSGEIDILSAPQLRVTLDEALSDGARVVEVDLSGVEFCDCYGLGVLLEARRRATEQGTALRLVSVTSPLVRRLLRRTGTAAALLGPPEQGAGSRKVHGSERSGR
ncbi:STAS domain-containing protein [Streptomyces sp. NPDC127106]|uniref:STAS domain-containing protein n=1 Tax=Streptomyces sp. NPDC127106 TaxID=3345360 RepID=UPI003640EA08